jgi:hypothetical protein
MTYTKPVAYAYNDKSGVLINAAGTITAITDAANEPTTTITLVATPPDWIWPTGYTGTGGILTAGRPTTDFKLEVWNELMFYLNKWSIYKKNLEYAYDAMTRSSDPDNKLSQTLTAARYQSAYNKLNELFKNLNAAIITSAETGKTSLTAKGLEEFGNAIKYENLK